VARNRQRAKQRQEQRRQERLRERGEAGTPQDGGADATDAGDGKPGTEGGKPHAGDSPEVGRLAAETGAPPQNLGRVDAEPPGDSGEPSPPRGGPDRAQDLTPEEEDELFLDEEDFEVDQEELAEAEAEYAPRGKRGGEAIATTGPRGKRGDRSPAPGEPTQAKGLARVVAFLRACWAELQRVQWPDRRQTTQLTAIVLVFIVIMGGYLGLLDAIVSRVVQEII
jgi:preprotein translocase SecE subunit